MQYSDTCLLDNICLVFEDNCLYEKSYTVLENQDTDNILHFLTSRLFL